MTSWFKKPEPEKRPATRAELVRALADLKTSAENGDAAIARAITELERARVLQQQFHRGVFRLIEGAIATAPPEES